MELHLYQTYRNESPSNGIVFWRGLYNVLENDITEVH